MLQFIKQLQQNKEDNKLKDAVERITVLEESNQKLVEEIQSLSDMLEKTVEKLYTISSVNMQLISDMQIIYDLLNQAAGSVFDYEERDMLEEYGMWYCSKDDDDLPN